MILNNDFRSLAINQPASFFSSDFPNPVELNLNEVEAITCSTFKELFSTAQKADLPYYLISLVKLKGNVYKIYDTIYFRGWLTANVDANLVPVDPQSRLQIEKIHYFALECFDCEANPIISSDIVSLHFHNYFDPKIYDPDRKDENLAIDALDYVTILEGNEEEKQLIKRIQNLIRSECFRAYEVAASHVKSIDENLNVDPIEFEKNLGFLDESSPSFLFHFNSPSIDSIPIAGGSDISFDSFENYYDSEYGIDLDYESESDEDESVSRLKQEFYKWTRAVQFGQESSSSESEGSLDS